VYYLRGSVIRFCCSRMECRLQKNVSVQTVRRCYKRWQELLTAKLFRQLPALQTVRATFTRSSPPRPTMPTETKQGRPPRLSLAFTPQASCVVPSRRVSFPVASAPISNTVAAMRGKAKLFHARNYPWRTSRVSGCRNCKQSPSLDIKRHHRSQIWRGFRN